MVVLTVPAWSVMATKYIPIVVAIGALAAIPLAMMAAKAIAARTIA